MTEVFIDRDGVILKNIYYSDSDSWEAPRRPAQFELHNNALEALNMLYQGGHKLFLVSNQPNAATGKSSKEDLKLIHQYLVSALTKYQIQFTEFFYCCHHPQGKDPELGIICNCRKPEPYFLLKASITYSFNLAHSWMIGDRETDIQCGKAAGSRTIKIFADHPSSASGMAGADYQAKDLMEAAKIVLSKKA